TAFPAGALRAIGRRQPHAPFQELAAKGVDPLSLEITTGGEAAMTSQQRPAVITTVVAPENAPTFEITPPRGWFDLNLRELWVYRELLYFLVWRDLKVRYKQ